MVAGVPRVDCDQWRVAQIKAFAKFDGQGRVGLGDDLIWEMVGDAVLVDRDERDRARLGGVAKARDDTRNRFLPIGVTNLQGSCLCFQKSDGCLEANNFDWL